MTEPDLGDMLDVLSFPWLALLAVGMALAPWPFEDMPHLIEKTEMLFAGTLTRPLDAFDLFVHVFPSGLLVAKIIRMWTRG